MLRGVNNHFKNGIAFQNLGGARQSRGSLTNYNKEEKANREEIFPKSGRHWVEDLCSKERKSYKRGRVAIPSLKKKRI